MAVLKLYIFNNPILRTKCKPIEAITDEIRTLAKDMIETMHAKNRSIGLAAPQVGRDLQLFIALEYSEDASGNPIYGKPKVYINPVLSNPSQELVTREEGCMSFPGLYIPVTRPHSITVKALNLNGEEFEEHLSGFAARMIMHENDHIHGTLYIDRLTKEGRKKYERELTHILKKYRSHYI